MDVHCDSCRSKFRIPDDKIPPGKVATLTCPKCKNKISLNADAGREDQDSSSDEAFSGAYDASEKPFDFIEEEGKTAMVCEQDPELKKRIINGLDLMEYHITQVDNARDALKKMRYHTYDLIVVDEGFDTKNPDSNGVLIYLERLPMITRRNIYVAMVSRRYRTMDNMMALHRSVNLIINVKSITDVEKILKTGIADNEYTYRVFKQSLRETMGGV
jgi:predicted Zn finger-like uncharacterized protein